MQVTKKANENERRCGSTGPAQILFNIVENMSPLSWSIGHKNMLGTACQISTCKWTWINHQETSNLNVLDLKNYIQQYIQKVVKYQ